MKVGITTIRNRIATCFGAIVASAGIALAQHPLPLTPPEAASNFTDVQPVFGPQPPVFQTDTAVNPANAALAPSGPTWDEYQDVLRRLQATEQRLNSMTAAQDHPPARQIHADGNPNVPSAEQRISALEAATGAKPSAPSFPSVRLSGFFHLDSGYVDQSGNNRTTLGDIQDGVGFRRARLQAVGSVAEFTNYSLEMDFATAGRPSFMDVWGEQTHVPVLGNVRIGHFRQPFSMDSLTSIRQLDFLERSLPFQAFVPFRRVGVMAYDKSEDEMWTWAYSVYRTGGFNNAPLGDSRFATDIGDNGGASFSGRVTHLLWYDEEAQGRYLLHVGGGYNYSRITKNGPNGGVYEARVIPEFFVGDPAAGGMTANGTPFYADTGRLPASSFNLYNLELAGQWGQFHFQSEYMGTSVNQIGGGSVYYDGAYFQTGYFLTGEHRKYNRTVGVFDSVTPLTEFFSLGRNMGFCGWGAWEVLGRISYVNLNAAGAIPLGPPAGYVPPPLTPNPGRLTNTTVGLNWIWNQYTNVQFNVIYSQLDNAFFGNSNSITYATRFQVAF